ncbi:putative TIM-barrel fold metal-dependent hydrolase [Pseudomonas sp. BIGb0408]|uniref:Putative TIM-barrel fold metal-dependent hydrolase n=1 Tax=Phytopseudomonas flavescens TaxID=29435 RepID=A0A7Z0BQW9_9GAMM|nr:MULTISPECIES: amidohydrolase family protein [Pseudomonas]MCW2291115.1 putative TIM-barrel fold metal-dependent hydrolase [Pseudomonas sp. BIGb0408]NYH74314.1 putative TIM-barrel fold metal-dependent hydrolase [Pseudomonas flavescens]
MSTPSPAITGIDTHAHIFRKDLPMVANRRYSPDYDALVEQYLEHLDRHGLSHGVLIQPSFLGTDNSFMVEALRRYPQRLRGVAVVDASISEAQLDELAASAVVGIRLNLIGKALEDYTGPEWAALFGRLARRGWQVEIQRGIDDLAQVVPAIVATGVNLVIDHFGLPTGGIDPHKPGHQAFLNLLGDSRVWLKLSAAYRSRSDQTQAAAALAQVRGAAGGIERFLWGSDWPNTQFEDRTDYAEQFTLIEALLPDAAERNRVLVDNPARLFGFTPR